MNWLRSFLYAFARGLGDINAVQRGTIGKRLARRMLGRVAGRIINQIVK